MKILTLQDDAGNQIQTWIDRDGSCINLSIKSGYPSDNTEIYYFNNMDELDNLIEELRGLKEAYVYLNK